jgi:hypothetical protein
VKEFAIVLSAVLPLLVFRHAEAQKLEPGKWTGTVTPPGEERATEVSYDVTMKGDTIDITVNAGEHGSHRFNEVRLNDRTLTFWFTPGPRVECTLTRGENRVFAGTCRDSEGGIASMVMVPPKKE